MVDQLESARAAYQAITGTRGMQNLLLHSNLARNYLPSDYAELQRHQQRGDILGLAPQMQSIMNANAVLTDANWCAVPEQQRVVNQGRQSAAMLQMLAQAAEL
jgi:type IV secretion system protein VirB5